MVGAGVVGLTCAVHLAEAGHDVAVLARDLPLETTSAVAGGLWLPYRVHPPELVTRWARATFTALAALAGDERSGVRLAPGTMLHRVRSAAPYWAADVADLVPLTPVDSPAPGYGSGWAATVPLVHTPTHLAYLVDRLGAAGGTLTRMGLPALPARGVVVNCTGLAARSLASDASVRPVRGQVVVLSDPGLTHWFCDEDDAGEDGSLTYVLPRGRDVVVGGTAQDDDWTPAPDPATAERILARATALVPALRGARVLAHRVGLRPARPAVRFDVTSQRVDDGLDQHTVHCYGHGGAGWTLATGCAQDVVTAVATL